MVKKQTLTGVTKKELADTIDSFLDDGAKSVTVTRNSNGTYDVTPEY